MKWIKVEEEQPRYAHRVLVINAFGTWLPGKRVRNGLEDRWVDDESLPIIGVRVWSEVVAPGETA